VKRITLGFRCLLAAALSAAAFAVHAEPVLHPETALSFPDEIAGLVREGLQNYEPVHPGAGVSYGYNNRAQRVFATVYVYTLGVFDVPTKIDHPVMVEVHRRTLDEIRGSANAQGEKVEGPLASAALAIKGPVGEVPVLFDSFMVQSQKTGPRQTFVWLWSGRGHFLKIRLTTYPTPGDARPRLIDDFAEQVVRLTATPYEGEKTAQITVGRF